MAKYQQAIDKDIKALEEKHQSLKGAISAEKYAELGEKIEEIRRLGIDLPDDFDDVKVHEIINQIVDLQFDEFSPQFVEEATKEIKKVAFLQRLEHIRIAFEEGKDIKEVLMAAEKYWGAIEKHYDAIEIREVRNKLDEIGFEITLSGIRHMKKVDMSKVSVKQNGVLIRHRLQELAESLEVSDEDKLLIQAWLGESVDINTGEIDEQAMERLIRTPKMWGVLAGVKEEKQEPVKINGSKGGIGDESEERKQEIVEVCQRYGVDEKQMRELLSQGEDVYIVKNGIGKAKLVVGKDLRFRFQGKSVRAVIYNNEKTEICDVLPEHVKKQELELPLAAESIDIRTPKKLDTVIFPDNLVRIESDAFNGCVGLKKIRFPNKLKVIKSGAFERSNLEMVSLPDSLIYLGNRAFFQTKLKTIEFGCGLSSISGYTFAGCLLESVEIPGNIECIYWEAFSDNPLKSVILHEGLRAIDYGVFARTKLNEITLPSSITQYDGITGGQYVSIIKTPEINEYLEDTRIIKTKRPSLEELKKQKLELEDMLAKVDRQIKRRKMKNKIKNINKGDVR